MTIRSPELLWNLCRKLAIEMHFQPSEIEALKVSEALWWVLGK